MKTSVKILVSGLAVVFAGVAGFSFWPQHKMAVAEHPFDKVPEPILMNAVQSMSVCIHGSLFANAWLQHAIKQLQADDPDGHESKAAIDQLTKDDATVQEIGQLQVVLAKEVMASLMGPYHHTMADLKDSAKDLMAATDEALNEQYKGFDSLKAFEDAYTHQQEVCAAMVEKFSATAKNYQSGVETPQEPPK